MRRIIAAVTLAVAAFAGAVTVHPAHASSVADIVCCFSR
jgi:hypothetical protein